MKKEVKRDNGKERVPQDQQNDSLDLNKVDESENRQHLMGACPHTSDEEAVTHDEGINEALEVTGMLKSCEGCPSSETLKLSHQESASGNVVGIDHIDGNLYANTINVGTKTIHYHQSTLTNSNETKSIDTSKNRELTSPSPEKSSLHLIKALKKYYQRYAKVQLPVFEIKQSIKDCYIHLALITHQIWSGQEHDVQQQAFTKLYGYETAQTQGRLRTHEDLFKRGTLIDVKPKNLFKHHQRVIVVGRAGIGKSTFCKRMIFDWSKRKLWKQFDAVYWLPLRYLLNYAPKKNYKNNKKLAHFICFVYKEMSTKKSDLLNISIAKISHQIGDANQKKLFLLDGYDEVAAISQDQQHSHHALLVNNLLKQDYFVLTSRPHAVVQDATIKRFHDQKTHTYELLGFTSQDIQPYIDTVFKLKSKTEPKFADQADNYRESIMTLLRRNPCIWSIMHVPINLALLCSVWKPGLFADQDTVTMTMLYDRLLFEITKRNHAKLKGQPEYSIEKDYTPKELKSFYQPIYRYLGHVALYGLLASQIFFDEDILQQPLTLYKLSIKKFFEKHEIKLSGIKNVSSDKALLIKVTQLGFWNWKLVGDSIQSEFFHLTFQEYFAAYFLVDWWLFPKAHKNHTMHYNMEQYGSAKQLIKILAREPNFEVVLWFCAGIMKQQKDDVNLDAYYDLLFAKRLWRSLWSQCYWVCEFKRLSKYLAGHCLEKNDCEIIRSRAIFLIGQSLEESNLSPKEIYEQILKAYINLISSQWLDESKRKTYEICEVDRQLIYYLNIAPRIKEKTLIISDLKEKVAVSTSEDKRLFFKTLLVELSTSYELMREDLNSTKSVGLRHHAAQRLAELDIDKEKALLVLKNDAKSKDYLIRHSAMRRLIYLGKCYIGDLRQELNSDHYDHRQNASVQLIELGQAKSEALAVLKNGLKNYDDYAERQNAAMRLAQLEIDKEACIALLLNDLSDQNILRRQMATIFILMLNQNEYHAKEVLFKDLSNSNYETRAIPAINVLLLGLAEKQVEAQQAILNCSINDHIIELCLQSIHTFHKFNRISGGFIYALIETLATINKYEYGTGGTWRNYLFIELFRRLHKISEVTISTLIVALQDHNRDVRLAGIQVLSELKQLDSAVVKALQTPAASQHEDKTFRVAALGLVIGMKLVDADDIIMLRASCHDEVVSLRRAAFIALSNIKQVDNSGINELLNACQDQSEIVRLAVVKALGSLKLPSVGVITALLTACLDKKEYISNAASRALNHIHQPDRDGFNALLTACQDDKSAIIRAVAVSALGNLNQLDVEVTKALLTACQDEDWEPRYEAVWALSKVTQPDHEVVQALLAFFQDKAWQVRYAVVRALSKVAQSDTEVVRALLAVSQDNAWQVRSAVFKALSKIKLAVAGLIRAILLANRDKKWKVRQAACKALRKIKQPTIGGINVLLDAYHDADSEIRGSIVELLGNLKQPNMAVIKILFAATLDLESTVRDKAFMALNIYNDRTTIEALAKKSLYIILVGTIHRLLLKKSNKGFWNGIWAILPPNELWKVRFAAVKVLSMDCSMVMDVITVIIALSQDKNARVRRVAYHILLTFAQSSDQALNLLIQLPTNGADSQKEAATIVLQHIAKKEGISVAVIKENLDLRQSVQQLIAARLSRRNVTTGVTDQLSTLVMRFFKANQVHLNNELDQEEGTAKMLHSSG